MAFPIYGELLLQGASGEPEPTVLRTTFESGPAKQVKIKSQTTVKKPLVILFTATELNDFEVWFRDAECDWGAAWFDWLDYRDGTTKQARIFEGKYSYDVEAAGKGADVKYRFETTLEVLES